MFLNALGMLQLEKDFPAVDDRILQVRITGIVSGSEDHFQTTMSTVDVLKRLQKVDAILILKCAVNKTAERCEVFLREAENKFMR